MIKTYSIPEAARLTGIPESRLYKEIERGTLKVGLRRGSKKGWRVTEDDIEEMWTATKETPVSE